MSIVAAPWRAFSAAARWNGQPAQSTTGVASASASHSQPSSWSGGPSRAPRAALRAAATTSRARRCALVASARARRAGADNRPPRWREAPPTSAVPGRTRCRLLGGVVDAARRRRAGSASARSGAHAAQVMPSIVSGRASAGCRSSAHAASYPPPRSRRAVAVGGLAAHRDHPSLEVDVDRSTPATSTPLRGSRARSARSGWRGRLGHRVAHLRRFGVGALPRYQWGIICDSLRQRM